MEGDLTSGSELAGMTPRAVHTIFDTLVASKVEYSVKVRAELSIPAVEALTCVTCSQVSALEIYNEDMFDLLSKDAVGDKKVAPSAANGNNASGAGGAAGKSQLQMFVNNGKGVQVMGLEEHIVARSGFRAVGDFNTQ